MLIAVFTVGTYLSQLNSPRTVTQHLFMAHFNNILVSNINRPFALFIVFYNKMFFHAFFRTNRQKTASSRSMFWMMVYTINIRIGWY